MSEAIYAAFTLVAACLTVLHIRKLYKEKEVKGVHWAPLVFMWCWASYGLFFFWVAKMPWTWIANLFMWVAYTVWTVGILRFWRQ